VHDDEKVRMGEEEVVVETVEPVLSSSEEGLQGDQ
jgi:hypothetical protein